MVVGQAERGEGEPVSVTIGRASLDDLYDLRVRGAGFCRTDIEGSDVYEMKALRLGTRRPGRQPRRRGGPVHLVRGRHARRVLPGGAGTSVGSSAVMLSTGFVPEVDVEVEQIPGFAKPTWETTTSSVVR